MANKETLTAQSSQGAPSFWWSMGFALMLALFVFEAYGPAMRGPFVFDDLFLPFAHAHAATAPLREWTGVRPLLGLSFWSTFQMWGLNTFPYHVENVIFHWGSAVLLFWIVRKLLELAGTSGVRREILSSFASLIFLLHPLHVEAVAYIASRSEVLSVLFLFAGFCVFLYRRSASISWLAAVAVLVLFGCAVGTKEHAVAFPALLLLTDYYWNPGFQFSGILANRRLYVPLALMAALAAAAVWVYVSADATIGFHVPGLTWYSYFFTECRAFFTYIFLFCIPVGQNIDHDFAVSTNLLDHGAALALTALLCAVAAAWRWRRRFPLASYGFFVFVILLAPTSSFVPIKDVFVERRVYLPSLGLLLIFLEVLRRQNWKPVILVATLSTVTATAGYLTWHRAQLWSNVIQLWEDSAANSPGKARVRIGLGNAYFHANRCQEAVQQYEAASHLKRADFALDFNWAAAYDCLHRPDLAAALLRQASAQHPSAPGFALLGYTLGQQSAWTEALAALKRAEELDEGYAMTFAYRGMVLAAMGRPDLAKVEFDRCLAIDPTNTISLNGKAALGGIPAQ